MGTTMVVGLFRFGRFFYAHVGDSRIYQSREKNLKQLTRDHSLIQELVDNGLFETLEDAEAAGIGNNVLTRGLGLNQEMEADVAEEIVQENDVYLFCTDGLTNMLNDDEIADFLSDIDEKGFEKTAEIMLNLALDRGAYDNVSFVLARPIFS
jgi:protein phosphatase